MRRVVDNYSGIILLISSYKPTCCVCCECPQFIGFHKEHTKKNPFSFLQMFSGLLFVLNYNIGGSKWFEVADFITALSFGCMDMVFLMIQFITGGQLRASFLLK